MEEFIARANIAHFLSLLAGTTDSRERARIEALLSEEHIKLAKLKAGGSPEPSHPLSSVPAGLFVGGHGKRPGSDSSVGD